MESSTLSKLSDCSKEFIQIYGNVFIAREFKREPSAAVQLLNMKTNTENDTNGGDQSRRRMDLYSGETVSRSSGKG